MQNMGTTYKEFILNSEKYHICIENKSMLHKVTLNTANKEKVLVIEGSDLPRMRIWITSSIKYTQILELLLGKGK